MKARAPLTDLTIRRLKPPPAGRLELFDPALSGFGVRVSPRGRKSWFVFVRLHRRLLRISLGTWPAVGLAEARRRAREAIVAASAGRDPRQRVADAHDATVGAVAERFVAEWAKPRNRRWRETERILAHDVLPYWGRRPLASIRRREIAAWYALLAQRAPVLANRALSTVKRLCAWCCDVGLLEADPAAGLRIALPERPRQRLLSEDEIRALWSAWTTMGYPWGTAAALLPLTAVRRGELGGMRWSEVDPSARLWTIPAARMKSGRPHTVPLSTMAWHLLDAIPRHAATDAVFLTRVGPGLHGWDRAIAHARALSGVADWRPHDLRRWARTTMARLGVRPEIAEACLGHSVPTIQRTYNVYSYLEERRAAFERLADHLRGILGA